MTRTPGTDARSPYLVPADRMTAVVHDSYGTDPEEVLRVAEVERPAIDADEVLVRVRAASIDRGTWHVMAGLPYPVRAGFGLRRPRDTNPGRSLAGVVTAVGADVAGFAPGDEVFGVGRSSFAEYSRARADKLAPKPGNLSFEQAAAVPISGLTALQAVRDQGQVAAGQQVLVIGASGGVGTFAVQFAAHLGAEVTGVCSGSKADLVRALGAQHVIDHTREDVTAGGHRYDVVLDIGGNRPLGLLRRVLSPRGRLVIVGGETGGRWLGGTDRLLRAQLVSPFVGQTLRTFLSSENARDLQTLRELIESAALTPVIDQTLPLDQVAAGIRHLVDGHARGKVVLTVPDDPSGS
ncbi:NAD(P)-dependent alcohol dehydrogenase [Modestobacter sp. VKM Ac-2984]|uniref:NAD(P)-dependent alcohol dehydrogenase n=1 Tax=Modestobacter sp. VKM Ac-2984 TaxID=3004138 RepID=UPI0022AAE448|nr:NAD(P)-dependent alcohol dehydrogenase [Modestobacter sp. VKM Ac-2984]MCZ2815877.1 NAD(P)-dependent alcohol dehydrogenase [Modestobacter sp. VKM Ac-2984]